MKVQKITTIFAAWLVSTLSLSAAYAENVPCLIEPDKTVDIGSPVIGVLESINVERGDIVDIGQVIATLNHSIESRNLALAKARAKDYTEIRSAKKASDYTGRELKRAVAMFAKTLAESRLQERTITSPFRGLIADRFVSQGQRIQDQPLVKIIKMNPLRVEVIVPAKHFNAYKTGDILKIKPQLKGLSEKRAVVTIVDQIIDTASNTFRLTLSLPNPDRKIPPGTRCSVDLEQSEDLAMQHYKE